MKRKCIFDYLIELNNESYIEFTEAKNSVRADIVTKGNDEFINFQSRLIAENWRANTDGQLIIDRKATINYMVIYATKGEKDGKCLAGLFNDVIQSQN